MSYDLGSVVTLSVEVKDSTGTLVDPGGITLTVELPDTTTTGLSPLVHPSTGLYHYDYTPLVTGQFIYRFVTTGTAAGVYEDVFTVTPAYTAGIVSLTDAKAYLPTFNGTDAQLSLFVGMASKAVERLANSVRSKTWTGEQYAPTGPVLFLDHRPVVSVTSITEYVGNVPYTLTEAATPDLATGSFSFTVDKTRGTVTRRMAGVPTRFLGPIYITYVTGRVAVDEDIQLATLEAVRLLWAKSQAMGSTEYPVSLSDVDLSFLQTLLIAERAIPGIA